MLFVKHKLCGSDLKSFALHLFHSCCDKLIRIYSGDQKFSGQHTSGLFVSMHIRNVYTNVHTFVSMHIQLTKLIGKVNARSTKVLAISVSFGKMVL